MQRGLVPTTVKPSSYLFKRQYANKLKYNLIKNTNFIKQRKENQVFVYTVFPAHASVGDQTDP